MCTHHVLQVSNGERGPAVPRALGVLCRLGSHHSDTVLSAGHLLLLLPQPVHQARQHLVSCLQKAHLQCTCSVTGVEQGSSQLHLLLSPHKNHLVTASLCLWLLGNHQ